MCFIPVYRRVTCFRRYKISRIIGNLLQREIFMDKFSRIKVNIVTREKQISRINIFKAWKISVKFLKIFILENN